MFKKLTQTVGLIIHTVGNPVTHGNYKHIWLLECLCRLKR